MKRKDKKPKKTGGTGKQKKPAAKDSKPPKLKAIQGGNKEPQDDAKTRKRANELEKILRTDEVKKWLLAGIDRAQIIQFTSEKWQIDERQADNYIKDAKALYRAEAKDHSKTSTDFALSARLMLYQRSAHIYDNKTCLEVLKDLSKLLGHYPKEKNETALGGKIELVFKNATQDDDKDRV